MDSVKIDQFLQTGFVILEDYLNADQINFLRQEISLVLEHSNFTQEEIIHKKGCILEPQNYRSIHGPKEACVNSTLILKDFFEISCNIFHKKFAHHPEIVSTPFFLHDQYIYKPSDSGAPSSFPSHRDADFLPLQLSKRYEMLSFWCPLDDVNEENGTLAIFPMQAGFCAQNQYFPIFCSAGSVVVLSGKILHKSLPNISSQPRRVYMPQFCMERNFEAQ
eukprot:Sdes_comp18051_c0_seq1m7418